MRFSQRSLRPLREILGVLCARLSRQRGTLLAVRIALHGRRRIEDHRLAAIRRKRRPLWQAGVVWVSDARERDPRVGHLVRERPRRRRS